MTVLSRPETLQLKTAALTSSALSIVVHLCPDITMTMSRHYYDYVRALLPLCVSITTSVCEHYYLCPSITTSVSEHYYLCQSITTSMCERYYLCPSITTSVSEHYEHYYLYV